MRLEHGLSASEALAYHGCPMLYQAIKMPSTFDIYSTFCYPYIESTFIFECKLQLRIYQTLNKMFP